MNGEWTGTLHELRLYVWVQAKYGFNRPDDLSLFKQTLCPVATGDCSGTRGGIKVFPRGLSVIAAGVML